MDLEKIDKNNVEQFFTQSFLDNLINIPPHFSVPCSEMFNEEIIGGILLSFNEKDFKFFNINRKNPPEPNITFRMIELDKKNYLIEIELIFSNNKVLIIHLDPFCSTVSKLLQLIIETKAMSLHFLNLKGEIQLSSYVNLEEHEIDWMKRNLKICTNLKRNNKYDEISEVRHNEIDKKSIIFDFWNDISIDCFVEYDLETDQYPLMKNLFPFLKI
jgi:hypothetical protein